MYIRPFDYARAGSPEEACALLRQDDDAKVLAGGQSLMPLVNLGLATPSLLVDVQDLTELRGIRREDDRLVIGAVTTHRTLERHPEVQEAAPLLAFAVRTVGNLRVRNRGTIGGSVAHADPAAELPMCLAVLEAGYGVASGRGRRTVAATDFATGFLTTQLAADELLTCVEVPVGPPALGWGFHELAIRAGDFAVVVAAAVARCEGGTVAELRLGLAGVAPRPVRASTFETAALGRAPGTLGALATLVDADIAPADDATSTAAYRARLARVLAVRAAEDAVRRALRAGAS